MITIEEELRRSGISNEMPLKPELKEQIASYVATSLCNRFPELRLNFYTLTNSIQSLNMYVADMLEGSVGACYFYRNSSIYFKNGLDFSKMKKLAVHECIHHFQEVIDSKGVLHRLGLCSYYRNKAYGNALNEASVQLMSSYANNEMPEVENYYGMEIPTDSPNYYPLICNLIKQIGYLTGMTTLFESTFYSNDSFFDVFKQSFGENNAFTLQKNFEKILQLEGKVNNLIFKQSTEEMSDGKSKRLQKSIEKGKENIKKLFLTTQNLIITSYFNAKILKIKTGEEIEEYRKTLYNFSTLIGKAPNYSFFNDYYIKKMTELDTKYEKYAQSKSIAVIKKNKITELFDYIKKIFKPKEFNPSDYYNK